MPSRGKLIFVTGAARSGKSHFAEQLAVDLGLEVTYLATCIPGDEEMRDRVARHQARRPSAWKTVEEDLDPARIILGHDRPEHVFLLDCLTLLVSNLMFQTAKEAGEEEIVAQITELAKISRDAQSHVIVVSNEVGSGIVPADVLSRSYRDIIGRANQTMASQADEAYITIAGIPVELKSLARELGQKTSP